MRLDKDHPLQQESSSKLLYNSSNVQISLAITIDVSEDELSSVQKIISLLKYGLIRVIPTTTMDSPMLDASIIQKSAEVILPIERSEMAIPGGVALKLPQNRIPIQTGSGLIQGKQIAGLSSSHHEEHVPNNPKGRINSNEFSGDSAEAPTNFNDQGHCQNDKDDEIHPPNMVESFESSQSLSNLKIDTAKGQNGEEGNSTKEGQIPLNYTNQKDMEGMGNSVLRFVQENAVDANIVDD